MTAPTTTPSAIDALLKTQSRAASVTAVYLIGGGALVASSLLAWTYSQVFSNTLGVAPWAVTAVALAWGVAGAALWRGQQRKLHDCTCAYEAQIRANQHRLRAWQEADVTMDPILQGKARYRVARAQLREEMAHEAPQAPAANHASAAQRGWLDLPEWLRGISTAAAPSHATAQPPVPCRSTQLPRSLFGAYAVLPSQQRR